MNIVVMWGPILVLTLLVVGGGVGALKVLRRREPTEPSCGQCGYAVRGLTTFACPECGSDLREVGIRTAKLGKSPSFTLLAAAWVITFVMLGNIGMKGLGAVVPYANRAEMQRVIFIQAPYLHATITAKSEWLTKSGFVARQPPPISAPVFLTLATQSRTTPGLALIRPATASETEIIKWLQQSGIPTADPRIAARVHDLAQCIDQMKTSAAQSFTKLTHVIAEPAWPRYRPGGARWFQIVYGIFWLALLIVGLLWLRRRTGAGRGMAMGVPIAVVALLAVAWLILSVA